MTKVTENQESKVIWENPNKKQDVKRIKSFRLPEPTISTIEMIAKQMGKSEAEIVESAMFAYAMNFKSIAEKAKDLKALIDDQVNEIDYNKGEDMTEQEYEYRQVLFKWSEDLTTFIA